MVISWNFYLFYWWKNIFSLKKTYELISFVLCKIKSQEKTTELLCAGRLSFSVLSKLIIFQKNYIAHKDSAVSEHINWGFTKPKYICYIELLVAVLHESDISICYIYMKFEEKMSICMLLTICFISISFFNSVIVSWWKCTRFDSSRPSNQ